MATTDTEKLNRQREQARLRQQKYRAKKKAEQQASTPANNSATQTAQGTSSWGKLTQRLNDLMGNYATQIGAQGLFSAFSRAGANYYANYPQIQNQRVKGISSLPADYSKEDIGDFLRNPYGSEKALRQTSEILRFTAYPYFKITKTYQDILTYRHFAAPMYFTGEEAKEKEFMREAILVDKINKTISPRQTAHAITGQANTLGKVFYIPRVKVDKVHNQVQYAFVQQLPEDWCTIIGYNNISGYTVSFNMMYFLQPGTDIMQFGDLFLPYLDDFENIFVEPKGKSDSRYVYASKRAIYPSQVNPNGVGQPRAFVQNGTFYYWVSLPIDKVWTFEIDDVTPAVVSPFSGLMLTYSQQSDFEEAQLSLLLNPLFKIFTGEIPYFKDVGATQDDGIRLSLGARTMFEGFFDNLMAAHNTSGTAFFTAPVDNIKSHDFPESANANNISSSFNRYGMQKAGMGGIIPVDDDVKAGQAELSAKLESRFTEPIYRQFERMMNCIYQSLNLKFDWKFYMFGSIYNEAEIRKNAETALANGDVSAYFILAALDDQSWLDKMSMMKVIHASKMLDLLQPPQTAYTQSKQSGTQNEGGRPKNETVTEGNEKSKDSGTVD